MTLIDAIIRTKRKTIAIIVQTDGKVVVRAPLKANKKQIEAFVASKVEWIEKHRQRMQSIAIKGSQKKFVSGEKFLFLGASYPLEFYDQLAQDFVLVNGFFQMKRALQPAALMIFTSWYQVKARQIITERVNWFARRYNFKPVKIRISSARTRWGSCSSQGTLSFTWRLIMAPVEMIDYVVVHELAHLLERNHGSNFWNEVEKILPDYKEKRAWLKENGHLLSLEASSQ